MTSEKTQEKLFAKNSLNTDVWDLDQNGVAHLFDQGFEPDNKLTFDSRFETNNVSAKFKRIFVPMEVEVSQQFNLLDVTELDLKKNDHSFRLRLKPSKALFHWDLGLMTSTKVKETAPHLTLRPYVFFASDRQLNRGIWSLGNFLYINSNWQEHLRLTNIQKDKENDVYFQRNSTMKYRGFTFNHLLGLRVFSPGAYIGNTFSLLASEGPFDIRGEYNREHHDKNNQVSNGWKLGFIYKASQRARLGVDSRFDSNEKIWVSELAGCYKASKDLKIKAKLDTNGELNFFTKTRLNKKCSLHFSVKSNVNKDLEGERLGSLPFAAGVRLRLSL